MDFRFPEALWAQFVRSDRRTLSPKSSDVMRDLSLLETLNPRLNPLTRVGIWFEAAVVETLPVDTGLTIGQRFNKVLGLYQAERLGVPFNKESARLINERGHFYGHAIGFIGHAILNGTVPDSEASPRLHAFLAMLPPDVREELLDRLVVQQLQSGVLTSRLNRELTGSGFIAPLNG